MHPAIKPVVARRRHGPRIEPPCPITVALETGWGDVVCYGVIADISKTGGCIWTDVLLEVGRVLHVRVSLDYPPEVHSASARVRWSTPDLRSASRNACCCGVEWLEVGHTLRQHLRQLANMAVPPGKPEQYLFEGVWAVGGEWPPRPRARLPGRRGEERGPTAAAGEPIFVPEGAARMRPRVVWTSGEEPAPVAVPGPGGRGGVR